MALFKLSKKPSSIDGNGLFTDEDIAKGEIIMIWLDGAYLINETKYIESQKKGDKNMVITGARAVHNIYLHTSDEPRYENFMNHSDNPNVLYHAGICYALENIQAHTELTTDYRFILSDKDVPFLDKTNGKEVIGFSNMQSLLLSAKKLVEILETTDLCNNADRTINCSLIKDDYSARKN